MTRTILFAAILQIACVSGALAATGAAEPAPGKSQAAAAGAPCSLLTKDDAAEALGEAVSSPDSTVRPGASHCEYSGSGIHSVGLTLMRLPPDQAAVYRGLCAQKGKEGLTALGDVACWYDEKHQELQVLKGTQFFSIKLRRSGDPTEAIKRAAKRVFDRLP